MELYANMYNCILNIWKQALKCLNKCNIRISKQNSIVSNLGSDQILHSINLIVVWHYFSFQHLSQILERTLNLTSVIWDCWSIGCSTLWVETLLMLLEKEKRRMHEWEILRKFVKLIFFVAREAKRVKKRCLLKSCPCRLIIERIKLSATKAYTRLDMEIF